MSDTPETDALHNHPHGKLAEWKYRYIGMLSLASNLERERDEARAELAELRKDKERLDWLSGLPKVELSHMAMSGTTEVKGYDSSGYDFCREKNSLRQAIDAAMGEEVEP